MRKRQIAVVLGVCICLGIISAFIFRLMPEKNTLSPLTCTFLKVGKADAMVLETNGHTIVIDAGEEDDGQEIVEFLKERNISLVDVLIITHYDKDHVGGADTLISEIPVVRILIPDYTGISTEYSDFMKAMELSGITPERIATSTTFPFGEAVVTIDPPESYEIPDGAVEYDNNFSLVTTVTHGTNRLCFTGDIEKDRIREMVSGGDLQECVFLKVPHHGIYNTALEELIKAIHPDYAVICSSEKHPAEVATLELLKKYGVDVLETQHGNITLVSNGQHLELHQKVRH
jgi:beta-lactamase superfamily II metal-dependent hydrolase